MKIVKAFGIVVGVALVLVIGALISLYVASYRRLGRHYDLAAETIAVPTDSDALQRGRHVAIIRGCTDCHADDLSGKVFVDDPLFGRIVTSNLTSGAGGVGAQMTPAGWEHAIRHGVALGGRGLLFMPSLEMHGLGDADIGDLIAYLHSLPPVDRVLPPSRPGPLARFLIVSDKVPLLSAEHIDHATPHPPAPAVDVTPEYGGYVAVSCTGCHQGDFAGGPVPGLKGAIAANLTMDEATGLGRWSEADFMRALRTGIKPDGVALAPTMPWGLTAQMSDTELGAMWSYFRTLPVKPARTE